jgi:hypothetical protein
MSDIDQLPPHCEKSERAAFGCILQAPNGADAMLSKLRRSYFYSEVHKLIFDALLDTRASNKPVEVLTVGNALKKAGNLEGVGGFAALSSLPDAASNPSNFDTYLAALAELHWRRTAIKTATHVIRLANDNTVDASGLLHDLDSSLRALSPGSTALPEIADAASLVGDRPKTPPEIVCGVLHQGSKLVLGGSSKANKTWCLLDLAISVATGEPWLSIGTAKGKVLYLNLELPPWSFAHRIEAICRAKTITLPPGQLDVWNLRGHNASFDELLPKIRARVSQSGYALIVLDPIYKLLGGLDENKAGDIGRILNEIEGLASDTRAAVAFAAHFAKGNASGKESIDRISGSGVFARDPDSILVMTRHEADGAFTIEATLRNFKPVDPFVVRWLYPLMRRDDSLDPAKLKQPAKGGRKASYQPEQLLEHLPNGKPTTSAWREAVCEETGMSSRTFYDCLKELRKQNRIQQNRGSWHPVVLPTAISAGTA